VLQIQDASVVYPNGVCALDDANLTFDRGSFIVLLGPSGAGKSTLLRCLNGLVRPTRGDVLAATGESIFRSAAILRRHRQQTAMIFQQHHLIGRQTVLKNVLLGRLSFRTSVRSLLPPARAERRQALEVLQRVGLLDRALSRADELSGGQQQRVGIARALIQCPDAILADEPVASLDPASAARVLELIHRICREDGITAIVSLHQVELGRRFADRIIGLAGGRVVFDAPANELRAAKLQEICAAAPAELSSAFEATVPAKEFQHEPSSPPVARRHGGAHDRQRRAGTG
jgi:phosphonate transport system ATP-binding protein